MSGAAKSENTVNIIIEAGAGGEFTFNDALEAPDAKAAREAGRAIANYALGFFSKRKRSRRAGDETRNHASE